MTSTPTSGPTGSPCSRKPSHRGWTGRPDQVRAHRSTVADLDPTVIAGCHTPVIGVDRVDAALELMFQILDAPKIPLPDQAVLDEIIHAMTAETAA